MWTSCNMKKHDWQRHRLWISCLSLGDASLSSTHHAFRHEVDRLAWGTRRQLELLDEASLWRAMDRFKQVSKEERNDRSVKNLCFKLITNLIKSSFCLFDESSDESSSHEASRILFTGGLIAPRFNDLRLLLAWIESRCKSSGRKRSSILLNITKNLCQ